MAKPKRWRGIGTIRIGGNGSLVRRESVGASGKRWRDRRTGRFITAKRAARVKVQRGGAIPIKIERHVRKMTRKRPLFEKGMTEVGYLAKYRIKVPVALRRRHSSAIVDAVIKKMREDGHKKLSPIRTRKGKKKRDRVRFFYFLEGQAYNIKTGKRTRAGTGGPWRSSLDQVSLEGKSKIAALFEGKRLANVPRPFPLTESDLLTMESGPDTMYVTAVYGSGVPVPGVDFKPRKRRK